MLRSIKSQQRLPRMIAVQIAWSGGVPSLINGANEVSLTDNGTGDVTITFAKPFARVPVVNANVVAAAGDAIVCLQAQPTASACRLVVFDATDGTTAKDNIPLNVQIIGFDSADQT